MNNVNVRSESTSRHTSQSQRPQGFASVTASTQRCTLAALAQLRAA